MKKTVLFTILLISFTFFTYGNSGKTDTDAVSDKSDSFDSFELFTDTGFCPYISALGEVFYIDLSVATGDYALNGTEWTFLKPERLKQNFKTDWLWDPSPFTRNQVYHPFFGSLYFNAARSENLSFLPSLLYTALGSYLWESIFAYGPVSINDFITTSTSGAVTGEVSYRLGCELYNIFKPLGWIVNPVGAVNAILGLNKYESDGKIYSVNIAAGGGVSQYNFSKASGSRTENLKYNNSLPSGFTELYLIYGNPFGHDSKSFYDQFDLNTGFSVNSENKTYFVNMDGLLFGKRLYAGTALHTLGVTFNYDLFHSSMDFASVESAGLTYKNQYEFNSENVLDSSVELNYIYLSCINNYFLYNGDSSETFTKSQCDFTYNYGAELRIKEYFEGEIGNLYLNSTNQFFSNYKSSVDDPKKSGLTLNFLLETAYSFDFTKYFGAGIKNNFYCKIYLNENTPDIYQVQDNVNLFVNFKIR